MKSARAGEPRVVLIEGEAGAGKSSLVSQFVSQQHDVSVLWASGDEAEILLGWGVIDQLGAASGRSVTERPGRSVTQGSDPVAVGAQLVEAFGELRVGETVVVVVVDDLQWGDQLSAQALLFALRRMQADRVLGLVSVRSGELSRLGEGWSRFVGGDHRAVRIRLGGLSGDDLATLARMLGAGELSRRAIARLVERTGGRRVVLPALCSKRWAVAD